MGESGRITFVFAIVRGIGGFKNGAKRNVKPDQLLPVPRDRMK